MSKYYVVDGVEALQKFGQDAWLVAKSWCDSRVADLPQGPGYLRLDYWAGMAI